MLFFLLAVIRFKCFLSQARTHISLNNSSIHLPCVSFQEGVCALPAGGLISGGGIMGSMMGRLPCSLVPGMEVDAAVEGSVTPFLEAGKD